ncbi:MAG TPA: S24 family peptidase [Anaerolineales bacterium]|nr:S24 family peptidase [Anaerolineales bacterium]
MFGPESTFRWIGKENVRLGFPAQVLLENIRASITEGDFDQALDQMDDLKDTTSNLDNCARASIHLECARSYHWMHEPGQALMELEMADMLLRAIKKPEQCCRHNQAIVNWMLGVFFWQTPGQRRVAIRAWSKSLELFQSLITDPNTLDPNPNWYKDRLTEMKNYYQQAQQSSQSNLRDIRARNWSVTLPRTVLQPGSLKSIAVLGTIPAGGFAPTGAGPLPTSRVSLQPSMDEFMIDGNPHNLFNLRGPSRIISLQSSLQYFVLKVNGDSMDKAGINPGDYVLLRYQDHASYGDIVAAEIINVDNQATLKSFSRVREASGDEKVLLSPQSNNQIHESFTFLKSKQSFFIRGVALGVFKPAA